MSKNWWKEACIYQVYPRSFQDSNGDGIGDLPGINARLDYIKSLGTDIIWLSPIFASPMADNGYDVSDYRAIAPEFGTMDDFDALLEGVHQRGMRLILDLVANHSSDEHAWFEASRKSKDSPYRDYYIWRPPAADGGPPNNWPSFFSGPAWTLDEQTGEYYLHLFAKKQPDLNWENPKVRQEIHDILHFWFKKGVDGFRMDVISLISKIDGLPDTPYQNFMETANNIYANGPRIHEFLHEMNEEVLQHYDVMALGEGLGIRPDNVVEYTGENRKELDMVYYFDIFMHNYTDGRYEPTHPPSLAGLKRIYRNWYKAIEETGWVANALGNHDFSRMVSRLGDEENYWVHSAKLLLVMQATQRGTLNIYQGDEIGMTNIKLPSIEDYNDLDGINYYNDRAPHLPEPERKALFKRIQKEGRDNARTPMQWDDSDGAGFSKAETWLPIHENHKKINVAAQEKDADSILHFYRQVIKLRKDHSTMTYGKFVELDVQEEQIYAYRRWDEAGEYLILLNFSGKTRKAVIDLPEAELLLSNHHRQHGGSAMSQLVMAPWEAIVFKS